MLAYCQHRMAHVYLYSCCALYICGSAIVAKLHCFYRMQESANYDESGRDTCERVGQRQGLWKVIQILGALVRAGLMS